MEENTKVVEMIEIKHLIRNSYKVMRGKMKKIMKNLEGVGMNTNKILITGLREGHQMNRAKKSYRSMLLSFPKIFLTIFLLFCLLLFANLAIAQSADLSKEYRELQKLQDAGGSVIGELDYNLDPGWWQYFQSCDRAKWVSYGQKFEPRSDYKASCDQQKHDFESVVKPTLSKTTEIVVPANGKIVLFTELRVSKEYHKEPAVSFALQKKDGSSGTIGSPTWSRVSYANGTKIGSAPPKPLNRNSVEKGDKIIIKIEAGWYAVFHTRAIPAQGARVQVFFIPDVPEVNDSDKDGVCDILRSKLEEQEKELQTYKEILESQKKTLRKAEEEIGKIMIEKSGFGSLSWDPTSDPEWQIIAKKIPLGDSVAELYDPLKKWNRLDKTKERLTQNIRAAEDYIKNIEVKISNTKRELELCLEREATVGGAGREMRTAE